MIPTWRFIIPLVALGIWLTPTDATSTSSTLPPSFNTNDQTFIAPDHKSLHDLFTSNASAQHAFAANNENINVPLLELAFPDLFGSSDDDNPPTMTIPKGIENIPITVVEWLIDLACFCKDKDSDECACPHNLKRLKRFLDFLRHLHHSPPDYGCPGGNGSDTPPYPSVPPNGSTPYNIPPGYSTSCWKNLYGPVPHRIDHFDLAITEKTLKYLRVNRCLCTGDPPCCPEVLGICPTTLLSYHYPPCDPSCIGIDKYGPSGLPCCKY